LSQWRLLLDKAITGLDRLRAKGQPVPDWVLGGGTALMVHTGHRLSKDIDAFIDDPQYISLLRCTNSDVAHIDGFPFCRDAGDGRGDDEVDFSFRVDQLQMIADLLVRVARPNAFPSQPRR
jgi:hypothetical protein